MSQRKKVLHILTGGKSFTGVSSYLYQYYRNMDRDKIQFDFLFCRENSMELHMNEPEFSDSKFFPLCAITKKNSNDYRKIIAGVEKVLSGNDYDIVVVNTSVILVVLACLFASKKFKNIKFIAHAHNTDIVVKSGSLRSKVKKIVKIADNLSRRYVVKNADYLFACSEDAGRVTFGNGVTELEKFIVINDAIDTDQFLFDEEIRNQVRTSLGVTGNDIVYGNVGKLSYRKNQTFLLDIFAELKKDNEQTKLWLIGEGPERTKLEKKISDLGLGDSVILLGQRSDVNKLMQGMDCFLFTTLSEGLGIVAIEAQAAGLRTVISDGVPKDVLITDLATQLKLDEGSRFWAESIEKLPISAHRKNMRSEIINSGYDINTEAMKFTELLMKI